MSISSLSFNNATRTTILKLQSELKDANTELATSRHADVGLILGRNTGETVRYQSQETSIQRMLDSNKLVKSRLELMDDTLDGVAKSGETLVSSLTTLMSDVGSKVAVKAVADIASSSLQSLVASLNVGTTGQNLFAGAQTDLTPMTDASASVAAGFQTFLTAVGTDLGTTVTAATLSKETLENYFSSAGYTANDGTVYKFDDMVDESSPSYVWDQWSQASDTPVVSRISKNETLESSLSTNDPAFRKVASAYALLTTIGLSEMPESTRAVVASSALTRLKGGLDGITAMRAELGTRINRVELADKNLTTQKDVVTAAIARLEEVDPAEASLKITALETQLEASYTVTGRLKNLSLLNYL